MVERTRHRDQTLACGSVYMMYVPFLTVLSQAVSLRQRKEDFREEVCHARDK